MRARSPPASQSCGVALGRAGRTALRAQAGSQSRQTAATPNAPCHWMLFQLSTPPPVAHDAVQGLETVLHTDLLTFFVRAARVADRHFVNPQRGHTLPLAGDLR